MSQYVVSREGMPLDLACWLHYGAGHGAAYQLPRGAVERVLAANPQVASLPMLLPLGTRLIMPALPAAAKPNVVRLWD